MHFHTFSWDFFLRRKEVGSGFFQITVIFLQTPGICHRLQLWVASRWGLYKPYLKWFSHFLCTTDPPSKQKKFFFVTFYHYLLNEIWFFACMGHFWKIPCPSKMFLLPMCLLCACKGRERVFPFFLGLAALCMVLLRRFKILLGRWIGGTCFTSFRILN